MSVSTDDLVVAIDGTSGSGKSSTSRGVADRLQLRYLDTGAMFRAMTWWMLQRGRRRARPRGRRGPGRGAGDRVRHRPARTRRSGSTGSTSASAIRSDEVNAAVSPVSVVPAVRARLLKLQREVIGAGGIVVEGRDIGSVVAPDAGVKVYLTADPSARAVRRAAEEGGSDVEATQESLLARDQIDSGRATAPLVQADGAVRIDTTAYTLDEVIDQVVALVEAVEESA